MRRWPPSPPASPSWNGGAPSGTRNRSSIASPSSSCASGSNGWSGGSTWSTPPCPRIPERASHVPGIGRSSIGKQSLQKQPLTRQEEFKRATAGTLRAIAHANAEVQVAFQPGPGGVSGKRVSLPLPTRTLPPGEVAKLRGAADAAALRLRHHSDAVHAARMPARREAKDVFDALEDVRVEAVGSRHMAGVAANLRARLAEQCEAEGYDRMTRKDQLPLPAALSLLARERITGETAPEAAHRVLDLWRDTLGEKAQAALAEMAQTTEDQEAFARAARKLLTALDLAEAEVEAEPEEQADGEAS